MLEGFAETFASAVDLGLQHVEEVVAVAEVEEEEPDCGESKDQRGNTRVCNGWKESVDFATQPKKILTNNSQICKLGINRAPADILKVSVSIILVSWSFIEEFVTEEILKQV